MVGKEGSGINFQQAGKGGGKKREPKSVSIMYVGGGGGRRKGGWTELLKSFHT